MALFERPSIAPPAGPDLEQPLIISHSLVGRSTEILHKYTFFWSSGGFNEG